MGTIRNNKGFMGERTYGVRHGSSMKLSLTHSSTTRFYARTVTEVM